MDPIAAHVIVGRPREEVFAYLADIANHAEFSDHYLKHWRLTRPNSVGRGAGARFKIDAPCQRFSWADISLVEVEPPFRIVGVGRGGKYNRVRTFSSWTLSPAPGGGTRVEFVTETEPLLLSDRLAEALGMRFWLNRQARRAMQRLQRILEEGEERGDRVTVGGV